MKCVVLLFAGLVAVPALAQITSEATVVHSACGPDSESFTVTTHSDGSGAAPAAATPHLYLIEEQERVAICLGGCGVTVKVGVDGSWAAATSGTSYIGVPVTAGDHHLCAAWQSRSVGRRRLELANFHSQEGQDVYFRVHLVPSTTETISQFTLQPISPDEGKLLIATAPKSVWAKKK